jgi:hypothetical protein
LRACAGLTAPACPATSSTVFLVNSKRNRQKPSLAGRLSDSLVKDPKRAVPAPSAPATLAPAAAHPSRG